MNCLNTRSIYINGVMIIIIGEFEHYTYFLETWITLNLILIKKRYFEKIQEMFIDQCKK